MKTQTTTQSRRSIDETVCLLTCDECLDPITPGDEYWEGDDVFHHSCAHPHTHGIASLNDPRFVFPLIHAYHG